MSDISQKMAEVALLKLAALDPSLMDRLIRRGDVGQLRRLAKREQVQAMVQGRQPEIPAKLQQAIQLSARPTSKTKVTQAARSAISPTARSKPMARIGGAAKEIVKHGPKSYLGRVGLTGLAIGGAIGTYEGVRRIHRALTYKKDYEGMLEFAPEIKNFDKGQVKARFDTLRKFNPEMSSDPLVASSWVKQTIEYPVVTPATLRDVIGRERGLGIGEAAKLLPRVMPIEPFV